MMISPALQHVAKSPATIMRPALVPALQHWQKVVTEWYVKPLPATFPTIMGCAVTTIRAATKIQIIVMTVNAKSNPPVIVNAIYS
jgi:hypothetical protein